MDAGTLSGAVGNLEVATALLAVVALAATVAGAAFLGLGVRVVPAGHVGVVCRGGRVVRTRPSGLLIAAPGRERLVMVPLHAQSIDPLRVTAVTRDGVEVQLVLSVLWRVVDASAAVEAGHAGPHGLGHGAEQVVERAMHHLVARVDLVELLRDRELLLAQMPDAGRALLGAVGVEVLDVDLLDAEVRVGPELIRLLT